MSNKTLYAPYKAVGYVTDGVPFVMSRLGEEHFLYTSIGKSFQVYRFNKLNVCLVSRSLPGDISCLTVIGHETFVAVQNVIYVYNRTAIVRTYSEHKSSIQGLLAMGRILVSYDSDNKIHVYNTQERVLLGEIKTMQPATITSLMHPSTYVNKIVVGYNNGQIELWNFMKQRLIFTFSSHIKYLQRLFTSFGEYDTNNDSTQSYILPEVSCIEQSPACDVVAVGFSSGDILILNLKLDRVLFSFKHDGAANSVTSLSFRTDVAAEKCPYLASGSVDGRVFVWNLGKPQHSTESIDSIINEGDDGDSESKAPQLIRKLECVIDDAHVGLVSRVHFLYGEPILVTSSVDNSLKVWIFDSPDGRARLLRSREGHSGPSSRIRFYGGTTNASMRENADGFSCEMISAGVDGTLRYFNTAIDAQNREMSQKPILKKLGMLRRNERLPQTIGFDFSETRQRDWGNLVTIHRNHSNAYIWRFKDRVVTETILRQPHWRINDKKHSIDRSLHSTAVASSPCGNFCVIGSRGGTIYQYNLQSGLHRGTFPLGKGSYINEKVLLARSKIAGNVIHETMKILDDDSGEVNPYLQDLTKQHLKQMKEAEIIPGHTQEVTGLFIDQTNSILVSCGLDGNIFFWNFRSHKQIGETLTVPGVPLIMMQGFRDGGFVAVAGQDRVVRCYDMTSHKLTRRFAGHSREITDIAFTPDGQRLITSSHDSTIRTWDMPTGRCVSWISFDSPVLSLAMSLSGEYLCLTQADKDGVFMYVDRSLYETLHFWKEPATPVSMMDSLVQVDSKMPSNEVSATSSRLREEDGDKYDSGWLGSSEDIDEGNRDEDEESEGVLIDTEEASKWTEETFQRGSGYITMSAIPRAYWVTLFHLESIKERNKPTAAPAAPVSAPFFLPTVVRGGSLPSFPTPAEYAKLLASNTSSTAELASTSKNNGSNNNISSSSDSMGVKRSEYGSGGDNLAEIALKKPRIVGNDHSLQDSQEDVEKQLASMASAWNDDGDDDWGADEVPVTIDGDKDKKKRKSESVDVNGKTPSKSNKSTTPTNPGTSASSSTYKSKILRRQASLPRCTMIVYLLQESKTVSSTQQADDFFQQAGESFDIGDSTDGPLMRYLKTIAPPAIDAEMRSICLHESDEEGIQYLLMLVKWFVKELSSGENFEILQAYLHRLLTIYMEPILKIDQQHALEAVAELQQELVRLHKVHEDSNMRFRHLLQRNLCLLKVLARLPIL